MEALNKFQVAMDTFGRYFEIVFTVLMIGVSILWIVRAIKSALNHDGEGVIKQILLAILIIVSTVVINKYCLP